LDKVISEILKPLKMVLCSSRETVSLKIKKKLAGPPVNYSGSNEPSLALQFKWLEYTFKVCGSASLLCESGFLFSL
jgi:hypothetical protein